MTITLKKLSLENFKGIKKLDIAFQHETTISGDNATGKSTIFDAFTWCLFGKDSEDRADFNIRPIKDGNPIHDIEVAVTAILNVDGKEIEFCRKSVEVYTKGSDNDRRLKGNETKTFVNGVPLNVTEYKKRVSELIDETIFKLITNPFYFAEKIKWAEQRTQLFLLANAPTDEEIIKGNNDFSVLLDVISNKSLSDYKTEKSALKKRLKSELEQIPIRIDQESKKLPLEVPNFENLEKEIKEIEEKAEIIDAALEDRSKANALLFEDTINKENRIRTLKQQKNKILLDKIEEKNAQERKQNERYNELKNDLDNKNRVRQNIAGNVQNIERSCQRIATELEQMRMEWKKTNERKFTSHICEFCGQTLPSDKIAENIAHFNAAKKTKLESLNVTGTAMKQQLQQVKENLQNEKDELDKINNEIVTVTIELQNCSYVKPQQFNANEIPELLEIDKQIEEVQATIKTGDPEDSFIAEKKTEKSELLKLRDELKAQLLQRELITNSQKEVERLNEEGRRLSQLISEVEQTEFILQKFMLKKIDECEKRINGLFKTVSFQLFETTLEGNIKECCIPLVKGIPFASANNAGKINAGIDIINSLCKYYNCTAPIFIDNRESVNELIETQSQIINLYVSKDKTLIIN